MSVLAKESIGKGKAGLLKGQREQQYFVCQQHHKETKLPVILIGER